MSAGRLAERLLGGAAIALLGAGSVSVAMFARSAPTVAAAKGAPLKPRYAGVNLAGGEFGSKTLPGRHGYEYLYPGAKDAAPFIKAGMTAVRLPFRWERVQTEFGAPLEEAEMRRLDASIAALRGFRLIILDVHNYGGHRGCKLGSGDVPATALADLWTRLATRYRGDRRIAFGIMNEPIGMDAQVWRGLAEGALGAIRATGARNLVLVPGIRWTGAHSWTSGAVSNAKALAGLRDPANNLAIEMHQYVDANSSGTGKDCVSPAVAAARLAKATDWLRAERTRGFLAEFGAPGSPACLAALKAMLETIDAADDVWLGWTYWAGGSRWNSYPMSVQPGRDGPKPQMAILTAHIPRD